MRDYFSHEFRPPPEPSRTKGLVGVVLAIMACFAAYHWADKLQLPGVAPAPATTHAVPRPAPPLAALAAPPMDALPTGLLPDGARAVTKCVVNGTTSYGDEACAQGARATHVITKANHNLLAGLTPSQMAAANAIIAAPPAVPNVTNAPRATESNADECQRIDAEIVRLDAMARQPQSGQMQDWISQQRKEWRDRQFRIRCR